MRVGKQEKKFLLSVKCPQEGLLILRFLVEKDLKHKNNQKSRLCRPRLLIIPDLKFFISLKQCGEPVFSDQIKPMLIRGNRIIWQLIPGI